MLREKFYDLFDEMNLSRDQEYDWVIQKQRLVEKYNLERDERKRLKELEASKGAKSKMQQNLVEVYNEMQKLKHKERDLLLQQKINSNNKGTQKAPPVITEAQRNIAEKRKEIHDRCSKKIEHLMTLCMEASQKQSLYIKPQMISDLSLIVNKFEITQAFEEMDDKFDEEYDEQFEETHKQTPSKKFQFSDLVNSQVALADAGLADVGEYHPFGERRSSEHYEQ